MKHLRGGRIPNFFCLFGAILFVVASIEPASAYVGPEVGSLAVQALIAGFAAVAGVVSVFFAQVKRAFVTIFSRRPTAGYQRTKNDGPADRG